MVLTKSPICAYFYFRGSSLPRVCKLSVNNVGRCVMKCIWKQLFCFFEFLMGNLDKQTIKLWFFFFCPGKFGNKVEIFEKHGLESLIRLLTSTDCDIQVNNLQWNLLHFGLYKVNFALINYSFFPFDDNIFTEKCRGVYFTFGRRLPESHCH